MQLKTTIHTITQLHIERPALQALRKTSGMFQMISSPRGWSDHLSFGQNVSWNAKSLVAEWPQWSRNEWARSMALVCTAACGDNLLIHIIMVLILLRSYLFLLSPSLQIWQLELTLGELTTCCTFGDGNLLNLLGGLGLTHDRAGLGGRAVRRLLPANACELWCYGCKLKSYHG